MDSRENYFLNSNKNRYKLNDFDYELSEKLIAQNPLKDREACRLMVLNRDSGKISHRVFTDVVDYLNQDDCLVLNNTKVFPARLMGKKDKTGAQVEIFLLRNLEGNMWEAMVKPARKVRIGNKIIFSDDFMCEVIDNTLSGGRIIEFNGNGSIIPLLEKYGRTPLPPYIEREAQEIDKEYYQTVYAKKVGAVAAPTAGLHFTRSLLKEITDMGVKIAYVTLHIGLGTFRPVQVEEISRHRMNGEYYELEADDAQVINEAREMDKAIIAIGTTSARVLETLSDNRGYVRHSRGWTDKFIYPPYDFKCVDHLLTNFHFPKSTLMMMVAAFSSLDDIKASYKEAIENKYRMFSYGDAMYII